MAGKWIVTSQRQTERLTGAGTFETVVRVDYQLASGTSGWVEIPARLYTEEYVRSQIDAAAGVRAAVENLQG